MEWQRATAATHMDGCVVALQGIAALVLASLGNQHLQTVHNTPVNPPNRQQLQQAVAATHTYTHHAIAD